MNMMLHCSICNSIIPAGSNYWMNEKYSSEVFCHNCYTSRPHCSICSVPLGKKSWTNKNHPSKLFCNKCYNDRPHCSICSVPMGKYVYYGNKKFCQKCNYHAKHCEICKIPLGKHHELNLKYYCPECYSQYPKCSVCNNIANSYFEMEGIITCKECEKELTNYNLTLKIARSALNNNDILKGKKLLIKVHQPHLCNVSNFGTIQKISKFISGYAKSDFEYAKECYYLCRNEIKYFREARWNPIECITTGKGNCSSKSGLLSSLLKARSIKVDFCEIPNHVFVVAHLPKMPKWCRMFAPKQRNDGSNWTEWLGMDPASNYMIGRMPKRNFDN